MTFICLGISCFVVCFIFCFCFPAETIPAWSLFCPFCIFFTFIYSLSSVSWHFWYTMYTTPSLIPSLIVPTSFSNYPNTHSYDSNTQLKKASFHADLVPPTNHNWNQVRWTACRFPGLWPTLVANQIRSKNIILKILTSNHLQSMWAFLHSYSIFDHIFIGPMCTWGPIIG